MNKRRLHHVWTRFRVVNQWHFLVLAVIFTGIAVFALRQNNLTAIRLRDQVLKVDQENGDVEKSLKQLRTYIYSHMNTDLAGSSSVYPPIQLKYRYDRLVAAEQTRVDQANHNTTYADAQKFCETTQPQSFFGAGRLPCIQNYIDTHPSGQTVKAQPIPDSLYKFNFSPPTWSPDLAGWSIIFAGFFALLFALRFILESWFQHQLNSHL